MESYNSTTDHLHLVNVSVESSAHGGPKDVRNFDTTATDGSQPDSATDTTIKKHTLIIRIPFLHDDDDPWDVEWMIFNVLNDYVQPDTKLTEETAALCIDALLPEHRPDTPEDPKDDREEQSTFMMEVGESIWKFAAQIPHDHEGQDKLVRLVQALMQAPITGDSSVWKQSRFIEWDDCCRHAVDDNLPQAKEVTVTRGKLRWTGERQCAMYINVNAFAARLQTAVDLQYTELVALSAVNNPIQPNHRQIYPNIRLELMPYHIIAGAQWVVLAGEWLWHQVRWGRNQSIGSTSATFPPSQWEYWIRGYASMVTENEEAQRWAQRAAKRLEEIMVSHSYTAEQLKRWDPKQDSVHAGLWEDSRYVHLFTVPSRKVEEVAPDIKKETLEQEVVGKQDVKGQGQIDNRNGARKGTGDGNTQADNGQDGIQSDAHDDSPDGGKGDHE